MKETDRPSIHCFQSEFHDSSSLRNPRIRHLRPSSATLRAAWGLGTEMSPLILAYAPSSRGRWRCHIFSASSSRKSTGLVQVRPSAFIFLDARWARATIKIGLPPDSLEFFQHTVVGIAVFRREYQSMIPLKGLLIENLLHFQALHVPRGDRDGSLVVIFDHKIIFRLGCHVAKNVRSRVCSAGQNAFERSCISSAV